MIDNSIEKIMRLIETEDDINVLEPALVRLALQGRFDFHGAAKVWEQVPLSQALKSHSGGGTPSKARPDYWDGDIPWASVKDITSNMYLTGTQDHITEEGLNNSSSNLIPVSSILVVTRMGLGKVAINKVPVAINQDLRALIPSEEMLPEFLYWCMKTTKLTGSGLTVKGIKVDDLLKISIPKPPVTEQRKIVDSLDEILGTTAKIRNSVATKSRKRVSALRALLDDLLEN